MQITGLSIAQPGLIAHIAAASDDTIGALAERSGLDQSTLSRDLRVLEQTGLVEIALVEKDLRRRAVWLTERGVRSLQAAVPVWQRAHRALSELVAFEPEIGAIYKHPHASHRGSHRRRITDSVEMINI
jgi:DNA-binding MarR family transcriptional regulator